MSLGALRTSQCCLGFCLEDALIGDAHGGLGAARHKTNLRWRSVGVVVLRGGGVYLQARGAEGSVVVEGLCEEGGDGGELVAVVPVFLLYEFQEGTPGRGSRGQRS